VLSYPCLFVSLFLFMFMLVFTFFFFQAEDGIRDATVTGVQTCALPIWPHIVADIRNCDDQPITIRVWFGVHRIVEIARIRSVDRSEERRVGKECRSRGSPCR